MLWCDSESGVHWLYVGTGEDKGKALIVALISWAEHIPKCAYTKQTPVTLYKKVRIYAFLFLIFGRK